MKSDYANFIDSPPEIPESETTANSIAEALSAQRALQRQRQELIRESELIRQAMKGWVN